MRVEEADDKWREKQEEHMHEVCKLILKLVVQHNILICIYSAVILH